MHISYSPKFYKQFRRLSNDVKLLWESKEYMFRNDVFDLRLKTHKLNGKLKDLYACSINNKYRVIFELVDSNTIHFHSVGTHDIYK